jgi:hypothetical protein
MGVGWNKVGWNGWDASRVEWNTIRCHGVYKGACSNKFLESDIAQSVFFWFW